jgi:hypothetical protein
MYRPFAVPTFTLADSAAWMAPLATASFVQYKPSSPPRPAIRASNWPAARSPTQAGNDPA